MSDIRITELKSLDELFETREVLQNKGKYAIIALQYLAEEEKLPGEFYPALNTFMIEFVERFSLVKKLSEVKQADIYSYVNRTMYIDDFLEIDKSALIIKKLVRKYVDKIHNYRVTPFAKLTDDFNQGKALDEADYEIFDKHACKIICIALKNMEKYNVRFCYFSSIITLAIDLKNPQITPDIDYVKIPNKKMNNCELYNGAVYISLF
jgi:hypothetical protein